MTPNNIGHRSSWGVSHFTRPGAQSPRPAAALTPQQLRGYGVRLERLQTQVVPQRQQALEAARKELTFARYAQADAHEAFRGTAVQQLEPLRQAAVAKLNGATHPAEERSARQELAAIETALRSAKKGAAHAEVSQNVEAVRQVLVRNVNHAQNPDQELAARKALGSFENAIFEGARTVDRAVERLSSAAERVNVSSHQLEQVKSNANDLAARLGQPRPYTVGGFY